MQVLEKEHHKHEQAGKDVYEKSNCWIVNSCIYLSSQAYTQHSLVGTDNNSNHELRNIWFWFNLYKTFFA